MKIIYKQLLLALTVAVINSNITAKLPARVDLVNKTGQTIVIKIALTNRKDFYQIISPEQTVPQAFSLGDDISNIYCGLYDKTKPLNGGLDLVDKTTGVIPQDKQRSFEDKVAYMYTNLNPIDMKHLPNFGASPDTFDMVKKIIISDSGTKRMGNPVFKADLEK